MPGQHQGGQRVVDHRLVGNRHELLADGLGQRVQPGARSAGKDEDDAFGALPTSTMAPSSMKMLAAGKVVRIGIGLVVDADLLEQVVGLFQGRRRAAFAHHLLGQGDVFQHRLVGKEVEGLKHHADFRPHLVDVGLAVQNIDAVNQDVPLFRGFEMVQAAQEGAFP
jgi:hypothetical protein